MNDSTAWLQHLGGEVRFRNAGGIRTRSLEAGSGSDEIVIMLHGTGGHAEAFLRNVVPLADRGYWAIAIDMLGHGLTDTPDGCEYGIADYVTHLSAFIDSLGVDRPVHLLGESLGGLVVMRTAIADPARTKTVITVVGGGLRPFPPTPEEVAGWDNLGNRSKKILGTPTWDDWRARMNWLVHDPASMPDELVSVRAELYKNDALRAAQQKVVGQVLDRAANGNKVMGSLGPDDFASFPKPVLYLWTSHNPTTPARVAEAAKDLTPVAEFELFEDCGHWPQYEDAGRFNDVVDSFMQRMGR
jgi:pimeloyl-ACP methyl ester carboxylesterase